MRGKGPLLQHSEVSSLQSRRRSKQMVGGENKDGNAKELIGAVMSPATSAGVAAKREATRFPSIIFSQKPEARNSPLPGPRLSNASTFSSKQARADVEDSAASRQPPAAAVRHPPQQQQPRSRFASESYPAPKTNIAAASNDLSALCSAVQALKNSSLHAPAATLPSVPPTTKPLLASASINPMVSATRLPEKPVTADLQALHHRMSKITLAQETILSSPPRSPDEDDDSAITPPLKNKGGRTPRAPANTPASPGGLNYDSPEPQKNLRAEINKEKKPLPPTPKAPTNTPIASNPLTNPVARVGGGSYKKLHEARKAVVTEPATSAAAAASALGTKQVSGPVAATLGAADKLPEVVKVEEEEAEEESVDVVAPSPAPTVDYSGLVEYDGDDVIMGDSTPVSIASASTVSPVSRKGATVSPGPGSSSSGGGGVRHSRFRVEALRQGVTPLRVRERRASTSSSSGPIVDVIANIPSVEKKPDVVKKEEKMGVLPQSKEIKKEKELPAGAEKRVEQTRLVVRAEKPVVKAPSGAAAIVTEKKLKASVVVSEVVPVKKEQEKRLIGTTFAVAAPVVVADKNEETEEEEFLDATMVLPPSSEVDGDLDDVPEPAITAHSPTMSTNPLAAPENLSVSPHSHSVSRSSNAHRSSYETFYSTRGSPVPTLSSPSEISNNPLFAGTPSHPTPPSVTAMRRPSLGMAMPAGLHTPMTGGSAASEGMKLAEKLHEAAERLQTPASAVNNNSGGGNNEDRTFQFEGDVQALLQALNAGTPMAATPAARPVTGAAGRALAAASTEERPKPQPRRRSSLSASDTGAPILDLAGFDAEGERTAPGNATPLLMSKKGNGKGNGGAAQIHRLGQSSHSASAPSVSIAEFNALKQQIADLEAERSEAAGLLSGYQGTIAELQDRHSAALVRLQNENAMLKSETDRLRAERTEINTQFETLYRDKYAPLKNEAVALRRGADTLRTRLAEEGGKMKQIAQLEAQLAAAQAATAAAQQSAAASKAEAEVAKEAERLAEKRAAEAVATVKDTERKWAAKFSAEATRAEQALAAKDAEIQAWKDKHAAIARQHDEAVHRAHLAQAAKERKAAEVGRKEEEICTLEVRLREFERVLGQYRVENEKFASTKERYKAAMGALEKEVAVSKIVTNIYPWLFLNRYAGWFCSYKSSCSYYRRQKRLRRPLWRACATNCSLDSSDWKASNRVRPL